MTKLAEEARRFEYPSNSVSEDEMEALSQAEDLLHRCADAIDAQAELLEKAVIVLSDLIAESDHCSFDGTDGEDHDPDCNTQDARTFLKTLMRDYNGDDTLMADEARKEK